MQTPFPQKALAQGTTHRIEKTSAFSLPFLRKIERGAEPRPGEYENPVGTHREREREGDRESDRSVITLNPLELERVAVEL